MVEAIALVVLGLVCVVQQAAIIVLVGRKADAEALIESPSFVEELKGLVPGSKADAPVALPEAVVDYCNEWLDDFAKDDCKLRAARLFRESKDWSVVETSLRREDGEIA